MSFQYQRPDGNTELNPRQRRMAASHQSQANGPALAGWWNRARCGRRPNATRVPRGASILLRCDRRPVLNSTRGCADDASTMWLTPHVRLAGPSPRVRERVIDVVPIPTTRRQLVVPPPPPRPRDDGVCVGHSGSRGRGGRWPGASPMTVGSRVSVVGVHRLGRRDGLW